MYDFYIKYDVHGCHIGVRTPGGWRWNSWDRLSRSEKTNILRAMKAKVS